MNNEFAVQRSQLSSRVFHYQIQTDGSALSYRDVLELWAQSPEFALWYSRLLAQSEFEAFRWETPVLTRQLLERPFEYVLVGAESFIHRRTDEKAFAQYFDGTPVKAFPNLGGDGLMIIPTPQTNKDVYGHLASVLRGAPKDQIVALWYKVGREVLARIDDSPRWLSSAGGGVAWLHIRLDSRPKYYHYQPYRDVNYDGQ